MIGNFQEITHNHVCLIEKKIMLFFFFFKQVTHKPHTHTHLGSQLCIDQPEDNSAFENTVTTVES